jgi:hypothetical protein
VRGAREPRTGAASYFLEALDERPPVFDPLLPLPELFDPDVLLPLADDADPRLADALPPPDFPEVFAEPPAVAFMPLDLLPVVAVFVVARPEPVVAFDVPPPLDLDVVPRPPPPVPDLSPAPLPEPAFAAAPVLLVDFAVPLDARLPLFAESPDLAVPLELAPELFFALPVLPFVAADLEADLEPLEDPPELAERFPAAPDLLPPDVVRDRPLDLPPPAFDAVSFPTAICAALEAAPTTAPFAASPTSSATTCFAWSRTLLNVRTFFDEPRELDPDPLVCFGISIPLFCFSTRTWRHRAEGQ